MQGPAFAWANKPQGSASLAAVVSAFVPTWVTGVAFVAIFILIRQRYPKIYSPRTHMGTIAEKNRTPAAGNTYFGWARSMYRLPDKFVLYHSSLDAYLFLRFLRTIIFLCFVGCCLTWPILMPVNAVGGGSNTELDKIGIGNVEKKKLYYAHAVIAWVFLGFVSLAIVRERLFLIGLRQAWAVTGKNSTSLASRTVLFLSAPEEALRDDTMKQIFGDGAVRVWPARHSSELDNLVATRDGSVENLEVAEINLIRGASQLLDSKRGGRDENESSTYTNLPDEDRQKIRPRHYAGGFFTGDKVDSVRWYRNLIKSKESEIEDVRQHSLQSPTNASSAIFVEFRTVADAQQAMQRVLSPEILELKPRYLGVAPKDVLWENLSLRPERRVFQDGVAKALVIALIVFWSIPSGFVGIISNISYLAENVKWLSWLKKLPKPVFGLLSGLVPPLLTSMLNKYVPGIFRYIFKGLGGATTTANEIKVQKFFFIFQVTQVFLVTAVFSGAATVFTELLERAQDPASIPALLARQLPKSSNYYLTYFLIQGITTSADNLLNWSDLVQYLALNWAFDKTPRQKFQRYTSMKGIAWGKVFPKFANFAIIAIAYSCIAPLVMGFATVGLGLYYFSYRHNLLFVIQPKVDTRGQAYTLALQHLMAGVYIAELALIGLFGLGKAKGPAIITIVLLLVTILGNVLTNKYLTPLETYLPSSLAEGVDDDGETAPLLGGSSHEQSTGSAGRDNQGNLSAWITDSVEKFFNPRRFASHRAAERWLREDEEYFQILDEVAPELSEEAHDKAYQNPAFTSRTPIVWLPRDSREASKNEARENGEAGLKATDQGAWLDDDGKVCWDARMFEDVPLL